MKQSILHEDPVSKFRLVHTGTRNYAVESAGQHQVGRRVSKNVLFLKVLVFCEVFEQVTLAVAPRRSV